MQNKNPALLPSGFEDLLFPEAGQEAVAVSILMEKFEVFGYERIKPPFVEFEDSLFAPGPGASLVDDTFRLMDPVSSRMMGVRSDMTAQIARIASSRLVKAARPLRLAYAGNVLRTRGSGQRTERQFCQVGCEIIGEADHEADIEACVLALCGLSKLGINGITLDLVLPRLIDMILDEHDMSLDSRQKIKASLARRETPFLGACSPGLAALLEALLVLAGPADKALAGLGKLSLPVQAREDLERLGSIYEGLICALEELRLPDVSVTLDLTESVGWQYHNGIGFTLLAAGVRGELGRGGSYDIVFPKKGDGQIERATGFTLYMDTVRGAMAPSVPKDKVFVKAEESWAVIKNLQQEGWIVMRGSGQDGVRGQCTHEYKGGRVEEIKQ